MCSAEGYEYNMTMKTCLKLVKAPKSKWEDARKTCKRKPGGDLVSITTKEKWDFIIKYLKGNTTNVCVCPVNYFNSIQTS